MLNIASALEGLLPMTKPIFQDLSIIKNSLVDRFLVTSFFVASFAIAGSTYRMVDIGFQPVMYVHLVVALVIGFITIFRRNLSLPLKSFTVVVAFFMAGSAGIFTFGLVGAGSFMLLGTAIFARLVINIQAALTVVVLTVLVMAFHLYLAINGELSFAAMVDGYELSVTAWINNITAFVFIAMVGLYVVDHFFNHLVQLSFWLEEEVERGHAELENSELLLSAVLNTLTYGVMWKNLDLEFIGCNQLFAKDAGLKSERDVAGATDFDFAEKDKAEGYRAQDRQVIQSGEPILNFIERYELKDGGDKYLIINRFPLHDRDKNIIGVLVSYVDITETKLLEFALRDAKSNAEQASRAKSDFLATMSHEIRTPINGVMGLLELALGTELTDKQREFLTKAELSAHTLLHIINQILDISKIEAGKMEFESVPFSLSDVLQQVQHQMLHMAEQKQLNFEVKGQGQIEQYVVGDPTKLLQILINLCSNSIKFTEHGEVKLNVGALANKGKMNVRIVISDTGIGIPKQKLSRLFESFTQADSSTTRRFGGTGLGLAIVKQLVEIQGGKIEVASELNKGTKVTCLLQYDIGDGGIEALPKDKHATLEKVRVLIVEDNSINQLIAKEMLLMEGATVYLAEDGLEALSALEKIEVDIVLMDIQMPRMDGMDALKAIRKHPQWQKLPVVAVTANVLSHEVKSYKEMGFDRHLGKPFQREQLVRVIYDLLESKILDIANNEQSENGDVS